MLCGSPRGCRVPSRWRSRFHEGAQAQGGLAGSHSLPVGSRSESKAPEPGKHRQVGRALGSPPISPSHPNRLIWSRSDPTCVAGRQPSVAGAGKGELPNPGSACQVHIQAEAGPEPWRAERRAKLARGRAGRRTLAPGLILPVLPRRV